MANGKAPWRIANLSTIQKAVVEAQATSRTL